MIRLAAAAALAVTLAAPSVMAQSLTDTLIAAYRNSSLLEQNRAVLRAADEDVAQAVATLRPVVDWSIGANLTNSDRRLVGFGRDTTELSGTLRIAAELTLFDFGANRFALDAQKELVLATRQSLVGVEHNVLFSAVASYQDVRLAVETVALRESNVRVIERERQAARDRFELGEVTRTDVAIAEARVAAARSALEAARGQLAVARESFNLNVGRFPGVLPPPPRAPATARSVDEAKAIARRTHYAILGAQHEVAAAELFVARAEAAMRPRLVGGAEYVLRDSGADQATLSLRLSQRLYAGGQFSALFRQAIARRDAARARLARAASEVDDAVGRSWAQLQVARASIAASRQQVAAAQAAFDGVREEATLGARTTIEVLNAEQELLDARVNLLTALSNEYTANYGLLAAMGLLTVQHLRLGVATYDPAAYYNAVSTAPATSGRGRALDRVMGSIGRAP
ncbi:MAG: TolC family outer membrane protein [Gemmobacter sp.]